MKTRFKQYFRRFLFSQVRIPNWKRKKIFLINCFLLGFRHEKENNNNLLYMTGDFIQQELIFSCESKWENVFLIYMWKQSCAKQNSSFVFVCLFFSCMKPSEIKTKFQEKTCAVTECQNEAFPQLQRPLQEDWTLLQLREKTHKIFFSPAKSVFPSLF